MAAPPTTDPPYGPIPIPAAHLPQPPRATPWESLVREAAQQQQGDADGGDEDAGYDSTHAAAAEEEEGEEEGASGSDFGDGDNDDDDDGSSIYISEEDDDELYPMLRAATAAAEAATRGGPGQPQQQTRKRGRPKGSGGGKGAGTGGSRKRAAAGAGAGGSDGDGDGSPAGPYRTESSFRGVIRQGPKWHARIFYLGGTTHIGTFDTEEDAARAYDEEAQRVWFDPVLNFLPDGSVNPARNTRLGARSFKLRPGVALREGVKGKAKKPSEKRESGYRGVVWDRIKWKAQIKFKNKVYKLGRFLDEAEAARAFDEAAAKLFFNPILNFLPDGSLNPDRGQPARACTLLLRPGAEAPVVSKGVYKGESGVAPAASGAGGSEGGGGKQKRGRGGLYRGVCWSHGKWVVKYRFQGKLSSSGGFDTQEAAARAHDELMSQLFVNPVLNFLPDGSLNPQRKEFARALMVREGVAPPSSRRAAGAGAGASAPSTSSGGPDRGEDDDRSISSSGGSGSNQTDDVHDHAAAAAATAAADSGDTEPPATSAITTTIQGPVYEL